MSYRDDYTIFLDIKAEIEKTLTRLDLTDIHFIPLSALTGDNVVHESSRTPWYEGPTLLQAIQSWQPSSAGSSTARMQVQSISRATDFRGVSGTIHSGSFSVGDEVKIFPSNKVAKIGQIISGFTHQELAPESSAVTLVLEPEVDATRGDAVS